MKKIVRVDMTRLEVKAEDVPDKYRHMGGRWLTDSIVCDEVDPSPPESSRVRTPPARGAYRWAGSPPSPAA